MANPKPLESKYKKEFCQMLKDHMRQGYSYATFGPKVGVARSTLYEWEKHYPEWVEAKSIAMDSAQQFFETRLIAKIAAKEIDGFDPKLIDTSCLIFALKTRFHKDYGEKQQVEHIGEMVNVNFSKDES
jgi:DNA-binding XRE family transcriptional regulator